MPHQAKSFAGESFSELKTFEKMNTAASLNIPKIFQKSEDEEKMLRTANNFERKPTWNDGSVWKGDFPRVKSVA